MSTEYRTLFATLVGDGKFPILLKHWRANKIWKLLAFLNKKSNYDIVFHYIRHDYLEEGQKVATCNLQY